MTDGPHLTSEEVAAYVDDTLSEAECARVKAHLADCDPCRKEVVSVSRLVQRAPRSRLSVVVLSSIAAAAAIVVIFVARPSTDSESATGGSFRGPDRPAASEGVNVVRAIGPLGRQSTEGNILFVWHPASSGAAYRLTLTDDRGGSSGPLPLAIRRYGFHRVPSTSPTAAITGTWTSSRLMVAPQRQASSRSRFRDEIPGVRSAGHGGPLRDLRMLDTTRSAGCGRTANCEPGSGLCSCCRTSIRSARKAGVGRRIELLGGQLRQRESRLARALRHAQAAGDDTAQARILTWLGLTSWRKGDYRDARQLGESALSLKLLHHLDADLFKSYNALGLLAWNEGRLGDATGAIRKSDGRSRARMATVKGWGKASGNLGLVYGEEGEFAKAREGFATMRRVGSELKDARIEGNALDNQAMLQIKLGEPSAAIPTLLEARRLYHSIDYGNGEQNALGQLGTAYAALGEQKAAFAALDSALALSRTQGLRQEQASNLELIAELYRDAGDIPRALRFYGDAQAIEKELGLSIQGAANLRNIAEIDASLGKLDAANSLAANALKMHRTAKARTEEVHDLLFLAELSQAANHPRSVADNLDAAERLIEQLGWRRARVELALTRARIADRAHQPRATIRALGTSDRELLTSGLGLEWEAYALRARAHARLGALDSAIITGRQAVAAVERVRSTIGSGTLRNSYLSDRESAYLDLVDVLLRSNRTEEALEVSDKMRGRALRGALGRAQQ